uniref:Ribosome production factor 2 homolog n=1 Tax=Spongospora subterranea TaxID=70186 RepID=A0A0H5QI77_9EUKA|eukprot:CRZ01317.1 hypothetical protein [Spongospora subterranea]
MISRKPHSQRIKRVLKARESKLSENAKTAIIVKGQNTSQIISKAMADLASMKKPFIKKLSKKNETHPFVDQNSIEFLSTVNDASLIVFGSHSKKRPHNLILGRFFDHQVRDLFEFGIDSDKFRSIDDLSKHRSSVVHLGSKPMFFFAGEQFELDPELACFKDFVVDFFHGEQLDKLNLAGLDRVIVCTAVDSKVVLFRQYAVSLKNSGTNIPKVKLEEMGPRLDITFRRAIHASEGVLSDSLKMPKIMKSNTQRGNVEKGDLGQTLGRVHMQRQDLVGLALRRMKGLKKEPNSSEGQEDNDDSLQDEEDIEMEEA